MKWICKDLYIVALLFAAIPRMHGQDKSEHAGAARPFTVVTEFYPLYVDALNVVAGATGVRVEQMVPSQAGCPEDYQLTPADMRLLGEADMLIVNGAGLEDYLGKVAAAFPKLRVVDSSVGLPLLKDGAETNPHLWVSPAMAAKQVATIAAAFEAADASHAAIYKSNASDYEAKLVALGAHMKQALADALVRKLVVFHDSMPYLARDLGLEILAVVEPAPGQSPSARDLADVTERVRSAKGGVALLNEKDVKNPAADALGRELKLPVYTLDTVTGGTADPDAARGAYLLAMEKNLKTLRVALGLDASKP